MSLRCIGRLLLMTCWLTFAVLGLETRRGSCQQPRGAGDLSRFLDDAVVAVVAIDLERLDLDALSNAGTVAADGQAAAAAQTRAVLRYLNPVVMALREQGVQTVYAAFSLHDLGRRMPYLVVPAAGAEQARRLANVLSGEALDPGRGRRIEAIPAALIRGSVVIAGNSDLDERLDPARVPDRHDAWSEALAASSSAAFRVILVPTEDQRRVIRETLPPLAELGGLSGAQIGDGMRWLSAGIDLERGTLEGVIEATDEASALVLAEEVSKLLSTLAQALPGPAGERTPAAAILGSLKADASSQRVVLSSEAPADDRRGAMLQLLLSRFAPAVRDVDVRRSLKQLGLAMHNFHDAYGGFPPSASYDDGGRPLLSWRVYLLPFLEQEALYRQFHLNEPWDSPHNRKLIEKMPDVFASDQFDLNMEGKTVFLLPVGETTGFHGREGKAIRDIADGTSNTIMVVEAPRERAVVWTRPEDFPVDQPELMKVLLGGRERFWTAFFDGSARAIDQTVPEETLRRLLTPAGGEVVGEF